MKKLLAAIAASVAMGVHAQQGLDAVFVIDESGSMRNDQTDVMNNSNSIFNGLPAGSHGAVVGYGSYNAATGRLVQPLTPDSGVFASGVSGLIASGSYEPGYLIMQRVAQDNLPSSIGYRGVPICHIQITDEPLSQGPVTQAQAIAALQAQGSIYFGIVLPNANAEAAALAAATGGAVFDLNAFRADPVPVLDAVVAACVEAAIPVALDIKPTSCPNPFELSQKGVLPVALLGSDEFDVSYIDPTSLVLNGEVAVLRTELEDVATPYDGDRSDPPVETECTTEGPDGFIDLTAKFDSQEAASTTVLTERAAELWEVCGTYDKGDGPVDFCSSDVVRVMP